MIQSMTGYGKAEAILESGKVIIEIRTLNSKTADVNLRSNLLPKDKDLEIRSRIVNSLHRGTIDVFLTWEANAGIANSSINLDIAKSYYQQLYELSGEVGINPDSTNKALLISSLVRFPDVIEAKKANEIITDDNWSIVSEAFDICLSQVNNYRSKEGEVLYKDVTSRVALISSLYDQIETYEKERILAVRTRIEKAAEELKLKLNEERYEQEMIFYLEKLDINEEKVRLRQHCKYFMDTIDNEPLAGKKLGFIIQEMGREINTTGSKANHAEIQKLVIQMKDELEKIREQSLNIL